MFDFSVSEMVVVVVVILITLGPRDLPRALHTVGRWVSRARAMASEFHRHVDEMMHEVELEEFHRHAKDFNRKSLTHILENVVDSDGKMRRSLELPDLGVSTTPVAHNNRSLDAHQKDKESGTNRQTPLLEGSHQQQSQTPSTSSVTMEGDNAPEPRP